MGWLSLDGCTEIWGAGADPALVQPILIQEEPTILFTLYMSVSDDHLSPADARFDKDNHHLRSLVLVLVARLKNI